MLNDYRFRQEHYHRGLSIYVGIVMVFLLIIVVVLIFFPHLIVPGPLAPERRSVEVVVPTTEEINSPTPDPTQTPIPTPTETPTHTPTPTPIPTEPIIDISV